MQQPKYLLFRSIRFARHMKTPDPAVLWLEEGPALLQLLQSRTDLAGLTFCAAGNADGLVELAQIRHVTLTITGLDLLTLYDRMNTRLSTHLNWERQLLAAAAQPSPLQATTDTVAHLLDGMAFLLDSQRRVRCMAGQARIQDSILHELLDQGRLYDDAAHRILRLDNPDPFCCARQQGWCFYSCPLPSADPLPHSALLFVPGHVAADDVYFLLELLRTGAQTTAEQARRTAQQPVEFADLLRDVVNRKLTGEDEISTRMARLPHPPQRFISLMIVQMANPRVVPNAQAALLNHLQGFLPGSNIAVSSGNIAVMLSGPNRAMQPRPQIDYEALQALLGRYDAFAAISNSTSRRDMLRTTYLLTTTTLQLGKALRPDVRQRVFFFEDYAEYVSIDLCLNSFSVLMGHDDIIYLTHPDAVKAYRYDLANDSNLLEVLYQYCINNGNISIAAKDSYMHRNTFSAKIAEMMEMIKADLSNVEIRQRMIFSYKILRYYDRYAKINLGQRFSVSPPDTEKNQS